MLPLTWPNMKCHGWTRISRGNRGGGFTPPIYHCLFAAIVSTGFQADAERAGVT